MSTANLWKMHALVTPAGTIPQIRSRELNPGIERLLVIGDGKINPEFYGLMARNPMIKCSTLAINAAMTAIGQKMYSFSGAATTAYMAKLVNGGGYAGSGHAKMNGSYGVIIPRKLSVRHNKEATFDFDLCWLSNDGITDGFSYTNSAVSLPSLAVASEVFTLGPVKINGTAISGLTGWDYDFGIQERIEGSGGEVWPTFGGYVSQSPKISVTSKDAQLYDRVAMSGTAQGGTASTFYLQKVTSTGRVAAGTASHIKMSMTAGQFEPGGQRESDDGETEFTMDAYPLFDGTNDIIAANLASAIS